MTRVLVQVTVPIHREGECGSVGQHMTGDMICAGDIRSDETDMT